MRWLQHVGFEHMVTTYHNPDLRASVSNAKSFHKIRKEKLRALKLTFSAPMDDLLDLLSYSCPFSGKKRIAGYYHDSDILSKILGKACYLLVAANLIYQHLGLTPQETKDDCGASLDWPSKQCCGKRGHGPVHGLFQ